MKNCVTLAFLLLISQVYGQTYQILEGYDTSSCDGTPVGVVAYKTDVCIPTADDLGVIYYTYYTCNTTSATEQIYNSTVCVGVADEVAYLPLGVCASESVTNLGDVSAVPSCADTVPVYQGNFITNQYYSNLDCTGDWDYQIAYDYSWLGCTEGFKLECNADNEMVAYICGASDCSSSCTALGSVPSGSCVQDDDIAGTSYLVTCTSGTSQVIASVALIVAVMLALL